MKHQDCVKGTEVAAMKRILALDGGGIRGLIPAIICDKLSILAGRPIWQLFDLIAGTSTGGILALGYAKPVERKDGRGESSVDGMSTTDMVQLYRDEGPKIFSNQHSWRSLIRGPRYTSANLGKILKSKFGHHRLKDAIVEVLVTSYDLAHRRPKMFTRWQANVDVSQDCSMYHVALATSAAPTYFPPFLVNDNSLVIDKHGLIDGGLTANNPAACAYVEAKYLWPDEDLVLISVGTGSYKKPVRADKAKSWGQMQWASPVIDCMFDANSAITHNILRRLLDSDEYLRLDATMDRDSGRLDNVSTDNLQELGRIANDVWNKELERIKQFIPRLKSIEPRLERQPYPRPPSGELSVRRREWCRDIPRDRQEGVDAKIQSLLDNLISYVATFLRGRDVNGYELRGNILLPQYSASSFPGQLKSVIHVGEYLPNELDNLFGPGVGVSGKVFVETHPFGEEGRFGVSEELFRNMPSNFVYVIGFPLRAPSHSDAFGVVCIDILATSSAPKPNDANWGPRVNVFKQLHQTPQEPLLSLVKSIGTTLWEGKTDCFRLSISTRVV